MVYIDNHLECLGFGDAICYIKHIAGEDNKECIWWGWATARYTQCSWTSGPRCCNTGTRRSHPRPLRGHLVDNKFQLSLPTAGFIVRFAAATVNTLLATSNSIRVFRVPQSQALRHNIEDPAWKRKHRSC